MYIPLVSPLPRRCFQHPPRSNQVQNKDARKVFADVRSVVETINKSEALKDIVDVFTNDEFG